MKRIFLVCIAIVAIFAGWVLAINPNLADILYDENNLFENLSVGVCAITLAFSLALFIIRYKKDSRYLFWLFFSLIIFIFIGDDIDWGRGYLGLAKHKIAGINFDGLHDILSIGVSAIKLTRDYIIKIGIMDIRSISIIIGGGLVIITLLFLLIKGIIKNKGRISHFFSENLRWEPFSFLIVGLALISIAMIIDDDNLVGFPHKTVVEESLEFLAAISFLFSSLSGLREAKNV